MLWPKVLIVLFLLHFLVSLVSRDAGSTFNHLVHGVETLLKNLPHFLMAASKKFGDLG